MRTTPNKAILRLIATIRDAVPDAERVFTQGKCYQFALILREAFPGGELWYAHVEGHMYYKINGKFYDIRGRHFKIPAPSSKYNFKDGHPAYRWNP